MGVNMDNKTIILLIVIIAIILVVGAVFMINPFKQESKIDIVTNGTVHTNTTFLQCRQVDFFILTLCF